MVRLKEKNNLFPVFLKLEEFQVLIVGGGKIALEKLNAVLGNSPKTQVTIIAPEVREEILNLAEVFHVKVILQSFDVNDLEDKDLVIVAVNDKELSNAIKLETAKRKILTNVADTPELCDFYLSSVIHKGDLKIAVSTNGKSPTLAKRIKETLNDVLPDELDELISNLNAIRGKLEGDFAYKVRELNRITKSLSVPEAG